MMEDGEHPSKSDLLPSTARRLSLHTASTVFPITEASGTSSAASSEPAASRSLGTIPIIHRRRTVISTESALPELALDLEKTHQPFHSPSSSYQQIPTPPPILQTTSIAIPPPKPRDERPVTPLSGRPRKLSAFESADIDTSDIRRYSSSSASPTSSDMSSSPSRRQPTRPIAIEPRRRPAEPTSYGHTSSPLSPSSTTSHPLLDLQQRARRPQRKLNLAGLPKFHPANFHNVDSNSPRLSPQISRHTGAGPHRFRHGSDAQQRLHQYQRDAVKSYTKHILSPQSPRLGPQQSPGTSITPLALEGTSDYLLAGSTVASPPQNAASARDLVDKLIEKENMARSHPEARSGSTSPAYSPSASPAISPVGGCY